MPGIRTPRRLISRLEGLPAALTDHGRLRVLVMGVMYPVKSVDRFGDRVVIVPDFGLK